jgi:transcriptional regulator with XRE-family HTH domain
MEIGAAVRKRRKDLGLTLQQVVDRMDMEFDTGNLSRAERGQQEFSRRSLESVAKALETTVSDLYAGGSVGETPLPSGLNETTMMQIPVKRPVPEAIRDLQRLPTESIRDLVDQLTRELPPDDQLELAAEILQRARGSRRE